MTRPQLARVVLWMTGALLSFSAMAVSVRELAAHFSTIEILTLRAGLGLAILAAIGAFQPHLRRSVRPRRLGLHFVRNTTHLLAQFLWAASLTMLPLATVFALEFTMPAWTVLLAVLMLGENLTPSRIGGIVLGVLGVLVILRPGLEAFRPAALLVLAAAFGFASCNIATKKLTTTETTFAIVFWMNLMQLPLAYLGSEPLFFIKIGSASLPALLAIGVAGLSAHLCLTKALSAGDVSVVISLDFMRIPLIAFVGWTIYGEALDIFVFAGAGLIVIGVLWSLNAEARKTARQMALASLHLRQAGSIEDGSG